MSEQNKIENIIGKIDLSNEEAVNNAFLKAGLYSDTHTFPIASLQFELTSHCNMFCKHCYNNSGMCNNIADKMTPDKWIAFAKYLVEHGGILECVLSGGEPFLLQEDLFRIMDILHDDGTLFLLLTNGYQLTEENVKRLKKYRYHWLQISIDGVQAKYHDSFRQKIGSWKNAVRGAKFVSKHGIPLKIAHCVTPYNLNDIDEMCDFAYSLGASAITVGELCLSGRTAQNQDLLLSHEQEEYLFQKVKENRIRYEGCMKVKSSNSVRKGLERHNKTPNSGAIIRPNGDIRIDGMAPFVIGNVLSEDFTEVWEKKIYTCWDDFKVKEFISHFDENDKNYLHINYVEEDVHL